MLSTVGYALLKILARPVHRVATQFSRDPTMLKQMLPRKCSDWYAPILEMIKTTQLDLLMEIPAYGRHLVSILDHKSDGIPVALFGDAIHPMSPFQGQGVSQALSDAVDLADIISQKNLDLHAVSTSCDKLS